MLKEIKNLFKSKEQRAREEYLEYYERIQAPFIVFADGSMVVFGHLLDATTKFTTISAALPSDSDLATFVEGEPRFAHLINPEGGIDTVIVNRSTPCNFLPLNKAATEHYQVQLFGNVMKVEGAAEAEIMRQVEKGQIQVNIV